MSESPDRLERWTDATTRLLGILGIAFIVIYSVLVIPRDHPIPVTAVLLLLLVLIWVAFLVDIIVRIALAPRGGRLHYIAHHLIDVVAVVVPAFRALYAVRLVQFFGHRRDGTTLRANLGVAAAVYAIVFVYFIALSTLFIERDAPHATITTFGEAVWWAVVTIATVGYGDVFPVTILGRFYATLLMAGGIVIVGTVSAIVISAIGERLGFAHLGAPRHEPEEQKPS
jgi:voltage-gated potassium channel